MKRTSKAGKVYDAGTRQNVHVCATQEEKAWLAAHGGNSRGFHKVMALVMSGEMEAALAIRKLLRQIAGAHMLTPEQQHESIAILAPKQET